MTAFKVVLSNGKTVAWEYAASVSDGNIIRIYYTDEDHLGIDGFGLTVAEALVDLLRAHRDLTR